MHLPLLFYTLIASLFDDPGFAHPDIGCLIFLFNCSTRPYMLRGAGVFLLKILKRCIFCNVDIRARVMVKCPHHHHYLNWLQT